MFCVFGVCGDAANSGTDPHNASSVVTIRRNRAPTWPVPFPPKFAGCAEVMIRTLAKFKGFSTFLNELV